MGKRKRRAVHNKATPPPSGSSLDLPQEDPQSGQRSSDQPESSEPPLLRHCRPSSGRPYTRRSSSNHPGASSPNLKGSPIHDPMLSLKKESEDLLHLPQSESRETIFQKPERIRPSFSGHNALSRDVRKMECMICQERLRKKSFVYSDNPISPADVLVVAVLVCGHAYHADCLDQKTGHQDKQDPPCPICQSPVSDG